MSSGFGAGVGLCYADSVYINLVVLYRNTYAQRRDPFTASRLVRTRLLCLLCSP